MRKGVKFWDGRPLTTADVVYSLKQAASKTAGSQIAAFYTSVSSIKATGPNTVTIKPPLIRPPLAGVILERRSGRRTEERRHAGNGTMCTGPYRFTKFVPDDRVEATRFNGYWKRPAVKDVVLHDHQRRDPPLAMRSVDRPAASGSAGPIDQWKDVGVSIRLRPGCAPPTCRSTRPLRWDDVHVRRALAYALDKNGLVKSVLRGYGQSQP